MANFYLFLVIYPLNHEKNQKNLRSSFNVFSNSARQLEVPLNKNVFPVDHSSGAKYLRLFFYVFKQTFFSLHDVFFVK